MGGSIRCFLKEEFTQKITFSFTHPKAIQTVHKSVSLSEHICRNLAFHHLLTNGSPAVNGCRQNESPNSR